MVQGTDHSSLEAWLISASSQMKAGPQFEDHQDKERLAGKRQKENNQTKVIAGWDWGALMEQQVRSDTAVTGL